MRLEKLKKRQEQQQLARKQHDSKQKQLQGTREQLGTKNYKTKLCKWLYSPKQHDSNRQRKIHC